MEEGSTLKLIIDKGPRKGETQEFRPGSVIRIGRVVRGNTIAIKESGISSKHLSIQFESGAGHWTILDLESSNGTILNGAEVVPSQPAAINDGDTIKIGEYTSISVRIEVGEMRRLRGNPKRRGKVGDSDNLAVAVSNFSQCGGGSELGLESGGDLGDNLVEVAPVKRNLRSRPQKGSGTGSKNEAEEVDTEVKQGNEMNVRRTRSSKKKGQSVEFNPTLPPVPESYANGTNRRELESFVGGEGRENLHNDSLENVESGGLDELSGQYGCLMNMGAIHESLPTGSTEAVGVDLREEMRVPSELNSGGEGRDVLKNDDVHEGVELEKMTLGEWFDYLEVYLPKQIYEETEAMILKMRQEAAKFYEFRLQQESADNKGK